MKHLCLAFFLAVSLQAADLPAFPGAEGFGAQAKGGRGGRILFVTNLNDSGPGSLREAVMAAGPRIVVFKVSGIIDLKKTIKVTEPYLTLAGQTAPGDGICLRNFDFHMDTHDVVVRFVRFRPGEGAGKEVDALGIDGNSRNVIIDHCSTTWSVDECLSPSGAIADVTVQWCLIAEGLNKSVHKKGPHGYGSLVRASGGLTMHHNLWAHNNARNPRLGDNYGKPPFPTFDIRNNVIYGWGAIASGMTGDILNTNYIANYIRPGPSSNTKGSVIVFTDTADAKYFMKDNFVEVEMPSFSKKGKVSVVNEPFTAPPVKTTSAKEAYEAVLAKAGAVLPKRDSVDARIVRQVRERTGGLVDSTRQVGGWPEYKSAKPPADSDSDGMPDAWEISHGLNPKDPSDAAKVDPKTGYTNIENYLNNLAAALSR